MKVGKGERSSKVTLVILNSELVHTAVVNRPLMSTNIAPERIV